MMNHSNTLATIIKLWITKAKLFQNANRNALNYYKRRYLTVTNNKEKC